MPFDVPGHHPRRFRVVYRVLTDDTDGLPMIEALAVGERADHIVYRDTVARLDQGDEDTGTAAVEEHGPD